MTATTADVLAGRAAWAVECGDALAWLPTLPALTPAEAAVVTDPPYGIGLANNDRDGHRRKRSHRIAGDGDDEVGLFALRWAGDRLLPVVVFASPWRPWPGRWRNLIVWDKGGAVGGGGDIRRCLKRSWELIQVARNAPMNGPRAESVWRHAWTADDTAGHIAAKPVPLLRALLLRFTCPGQLVIDPFAGRAPVGVACLQTGRRYLGCETDPAHHGAALARLAEAEGGGPLFAAPSRPTLFGGAAP
jgi:DNA modification methylase